MRVLLVSQEFPPETGWGGIGTYVDEISRSLSASGVEVHVLSVAPEQPATTRKSGDVTIHRFPLPEIRGPGRLMPEAWRRIWLPAVVARCVTRLNIRPDVIECPDWNAEGLFLALKRATPLVVRLHSSASQLFHFTGQGQRGFGVDGRLAASLEAAAIRRANVVVSSSSNLAEMSPRIGLREEALHAVQTPMPLPPASPFRESRNPRVTCVGRLEPRKAPEVLLRAAPKVLEAVPGARFTFVGRDGVAAGAPSSAGWLRREAERLGISESVEVLGQVERERVAEVLDHSVVCVFPSHWEAAPNAVAEASAMGRPVVVSDIPPFREVVQDRITGRIMPSREPCEWATALIEILRDQLGAQAMGAAASAHIARICDPSLIARQTIAGYEHAIERWQQGARAARR